MPNKSEQLSGRSVLKDFLELFPYEQIAALGKIAGAQLEQLGVNAHCVSSPSIRWGKTFSPANRQDRSLIVQQTTAFGGSLFLINAVKRSIGRGKNVVVLCSLEISRIVWEETQLQRNRFLAHHRRGPAPFFFPQLEIRPRH